MSRVTAVVLLGFSFWAGCKESPQKISSCLPIESNPNTETSEECTKQTPDIIINDPNDLIAFKNLYKNLPKEIPACPETHCKNKSRFIIKPRSDIDYMSH